MNRHQIVNIPYNLLIKLRNSSDLYTRHWFWIYVKHNLSHLKWWLMLKRMVFYSYLLHLRNLLLYCGYFWRNHTHWRNSLFDTVVEELGTGDIGKRYMPELLPHTYLLSLICCCLNKDFYPLLKLQSMGERGTERDLSFLIGGSIYFQIYQCSCACDTLSHADTWFPSFSWLHYYTTVILNCHSIKSEDITWY